MKNSDSLTFRNAGKKAFFARDFKTAFSYFERAALLGDAEAQCFLGGFYDDFGHGFPVDFSKARELYEQSLAQGFARAGTLLGALYGNGEGVPRDKAKAEKLLNAALACGDAYAAYQKAFLLLFDIDDEAKSKDEISLENARAAFDLVRRAETDEEFIRIYGKISPLYELAVSRAAGKLGGEALETEMRAVCRVLRRSLKEAVTPYITFLYVSAFVMYFINDATLLEELLREMVQDAPAAFKSCVAWRLYNAGKPGAFALALEAFGAVPDFDSAFLIALAYAFGEEVSEKPDEARHWFDRGLALADPDKDRGTLGDMHVRFGIFELNQGNEAAAEKHFRTAAEFGDADGAGELARMLFLREDPEAFVFAKKGAEQGVFRASHVLAACYRDGVGTEKNPKKFVELVGKLDAEDVAEGAYMLGTAYRYGCGVSENEALAIRYFERADALGDDSAAGQIAQIYRTREPADERAFKWAEKGAKRGDIDAMLELAFCFRNGIGTKCDEDLELEWLLKAADSGDSTAQLFAGSLLVSREEFYRAREQLQAAFDAGEADAAFQLARCEWNDSDGDSEAAVRWAKLATKNGDAEAWGILGLCAWHGAGLPRSREKARACWRNGSKLGDKYCDELLANPPEQED